jgi:hypothetical protein
VKYPLRCIGFRERNPCFRATDIRRDHIHSGILRGVRATNED